MARKISALHRIEIPMAASPPHIVTQAFGVAAGDADAVLNGPLPLMLGPATPPLLARNQHPSPRENCGAAVLVRLRAGETERASLPIHK